MTTRTQKLRDANRPVAMHEAGHCIIGRLVGFETDELHIDINAEGAAGGSTVSPHTALNTLEDVVDYSERRAKMVCAGAVSQHLVGANINEAHVQRTLETTALNDWSKATEHFRIICGIRHQQDPATCLKTVSDDLLDQTAKLCIQEVRKIRAVADAVLKKVDGYGRFEISRAEIASAISSN